MVGESEGGCDREFKEGSAKEGNGEERVKEREREKESKLVRKEEGLKLKLCKLLVEEMRLGEGVEVFEIESCGGRRR